MDGIKAYNVTIMSNDTKDFYTTYGVLTYHYSDAKVHKYDTNSLRMCIVVSLPERFQYGFEAVMKDFGISIKVEEA